MKLKIVEIIESEYPPGPERDAALEKVYKEIGEAFAEGFMKILQEAAKSRVKVHQPEAECESSGR